MLTLLLVACFASATFANPLLVPRENGPIVETTAGQLEGETLPCGMFCNYFSFKGIPYAIAPLGNRRFRPPAAHPGWTGVRPALEHGNNCPTGGGLLGSYEGDEDCLFLNVYSRNLAGRRPVMVWIHGGSFTAGSGDNSTYGPEYYMVDDVVVVTINYRLGFLGFLSTGDAAAPGNWGLKDAVEALRWVQQNIARFGGDPDNVTIFGESAGSVAVHFLVLSELAKGLFHKAISQSGMALNPWAYQPDPLRVTEDLARRLGILYTSNADLVDQLRMVPFQDLVANQDGWLAIDRPRGFSPFDIAPCAEPSSVSPIIIDRSPLEIMRSGNWNDVPYIIGYNSDESMFMQREHIFDFGVHRFFIDNPWAWVPELWNVPSSHPDTVTIMNEYQQLYFEGEPPSRQRDKEWTWYQSDHQFIYGIDKTVEYFSAQQSSVYFYRFSYDGALNVPKRLLLLQFPGAIHADELPYMFDQDIPFPVLPTNFAFTVGRRLVRLWSNFAKYGNPSPVGDALLQNANWPRVTNQQQYLDIGIDLVSGTHPTGDRMAVWKDLEKRFARFD